MGFLKGFYCVIIATKKHLYLQTDGFSVEMKRWWKLYTYSRIFMFYDVWMLSWMVICVTLKCVDNRYIKCLHSVATGDHTMYTSNIFWHSHVMHSIYSSVANLYVGFFSTHVYRFNLWLICTVLTIIYVWYRNYYTIVLWRPGYLSPSICLRTSPDIPEAYRSISLLHFSFSIISKPELLGRWRFWYFSYEITITILLFGCLIIFW